MKKFFTLALFAVAALFSAAVNANAVYPYTNPTYIPSAVSPMANYVAPADYVFTTSNISTAALQVTGTCTGLVAAVQGTTEVAGTPTWTALNVVPVAGGTPIASLTTTGLWRIDTAGFAQVRLHITALTATCNVAMSGTSAPAVAFQNVSDPCTSAAIPKTSVLLNQATATTAVIVAASAGKSVYACSFSATAAGTNPTFTFTSGTQVTNPCDTTAALLTGAFTPSATVGVVSYGPGNVAFKTAASFQLCLTTAATTSVQGVLTYVQQ